jgi:6-pyruvoyl tetrahydropterin synthase/QueD family protein
MVERKILIQHGNLEFSAAHFITLEGTCEPLHGHNYDIEVEVQGELTGDSYILNFVTLKNLTRAIARELDHVFLLPLHNRHLIIAESAEAWQLRFGSLRYVLPKESVRPLPIDNVTAERLAEYICGRLAQELTNSGLTNLRTITVGIMETPMQTAFYTMALPGREASQS